jgi:hypothetical protein
MALMAGHRHTCLLRPPARRPNSLNARTVTRSSWLPPGRRGTPSAPWTARARGWRAAPAGRRECRSTVKENGSAGTDHGTAGPLFLAGRCVKAGLVGTTPKLLDPDPRHGDLRVRLDFRRVCAAVLEDWLGIPARAGPGGRVREAAAVPCENGIESFLSVFAEDKLSFLRSCRSQRKNPMKVFWKIVLLLLVGFWACWLFSEIEFGLNGRPPRAFTRTGDSRPEKADESPEFDHAIPSRQR